MAMGIWDDDDDDMDPSLTLIMRCWRLCELAHRIEAQERRFDEYEQMERLSRRVEEISRAGPSQ